MVAPVLVKALQDSETLVRLSAVEALNRAAPEVAKKAGATAMLIALTKNPHDRIASIAVAALGRSGIQPDLAVPALIDCLQSTNSLVACTAVWALESAPHEFLAYSGSIIPALWSVAQRKDDVARYARTALVKWESRSEAKPGTK